MPGTLYIVSTPLGNLEDITLRALRILKEVDVIAAEDTRHTRKLLSAYDIHTPLTSYFDQNETQKTPHLVQKLEEGNSIALVSDAGTPGISDPGYHIINAAIEREIAVVPIPGPSAVMTALTVSGFPAENFVFIGFLTNPRRNRIKKLQDIQHHQGTLVAYVSPHHVLKVLRDVYEMLGNRRVVVTRELTKHFEEILRAHLVDALEMLTQRSQIKGEFTLIIEGAQPSAAEGVEPERIREELSHCMAEYGMTRKDAVKFVVEKLNVPKNRVYKESLKV